MLLALALLSSLHAAPVALADSVAGTWQITGDVAGNPLKELCTIKQSGTTLTGSCTNESGGPYEVTGRVDGAKITFSHGGDYQGQALTMSYSATLAAPRALKGSIDVQPFGVSGTFTATPAPAKP